MDRGVQRGFLVRLLSLFMAVERNGASSGAQGSFRVTPVGASLNSEALLLIVWHVNILKR